MHATIAAADSTTFPCHPLSACHLPTTASSPPSMLSPAASRTNEHMSRSLVTCVAWLYSCPVTQPSTQMLARLLPPPPPPCRHPPLCLSTPAASRASAAARPLPASASLGVPNQTWPGRCASWHTAAHTGTTHSGVSVDLAPCTRRGFPAQVVVWSGQAGALSKPSTLARCAAGSTLPCPQATIPCSQLRAFHANAGPGNSGPGPFHQQHAAPGLLPTPSQAGQTEQQTAPAKCVSAALPVHAANFPPAGWQIAAKALSSAC